MKSEDPQRDRQGEVLFIDARNVGYMETRTQRNLSPEDVAKIADTYNAWRGDPNLQPYEDVPGFCAAVSLDDVAEAGFALSPGRYVGAEEVEDDGIPVEEKIAALTEQIREGFAARAELQAKVDAALDALAVE